jgi:hypothetical protein
LVKKADQNHRFRGATRSELGELLQDEDVRFMGATSGKLEELAQLVNEDKRAQVAELNRRGVHLGERSYDGGAVEEGLTLSATEKLPQAVNVWLKPAFLRSRNSGEDALDEAQRSRGSAASDENGKEAFARVREGFAAEQALGEHGINRLELVTRSGGRVAVATKQAREIHGEGGFADAVRAGDGPSAIRGIVTQPFGDSAQNLTSCGGDDVIAIALAAGVIFLKIDGAQKTRPDLNEIGEELRRSGFHQEFEW